MAGLKCTNAVIKAVASVVTMAGLVKSTGKSSFIHPQKKSVIKSNDIRARGEIVTANVIIIAYITVHGISKNFLSFIKFNTCYSPFVFMLNILLR